MKKSSSSNLKLPPIAGNRGRQREFDDLNAQQKREEEQERNRERSDEEEEEQEPLPVIGDRVSRPRDVGNLGQRLSRLSLPPIIDTAYSRVQQVVRRDSSAPRRTSTRSVIALDSISRSHLHEITELWHCARNDCIRASCDDGGFGGWSLSRRGRIPDVFTLRCGHYLCSICKAQAEAARVETDEKLNVKEMYPCPYPRCNMSHFSRDLQNLPHAFHVEKMIGILVATGYECEESRGSAVRQRGRSYKAFYPSDAMVICNTCTDNAVIGMPGQPYLICLFDAGSPTHSGHSIQLLEKKFHPTHPIHRESIQISKNRLKWNLSIPPLTQLTEIARNILKCSICHNSYCQQLQDRSPIMRDCGHTSCYDCFGNTKRNPECREMGCRKPLTDSYRPALDLEVAMRRNANYFIVCDGCKLKHANELFEVNPLQVRNGQGLRLCHYCRREPPYDRM